MSTIPPARDPQPATLTRLNNAAMELNHEVSAECNPVFRKDADGGRLELTIEGADAVPPAVLGVAARYEVSLATAQPQGDHYRVVLV